MIPPYIVLSRTKFSRISRKIGLDPWKEQLNQGFMWRSGQIGFFWKKFQAKFLKIFIRSFPVFLLIESPVLLRSR
jgi:hypothetical protein